MRFFSTKDRGQSFSLTEALEKSLAPDGGLLVPETFPRFPADAFRGHEEIPELAFRWLAPFFAGSDLESELAAIVEKTFDFPVPLRALDHLTSVLELFHGPTAAFKDFGARFLAECLSRGAERRRTVLVATSGDTGGAVAAAFHRRRGFEVLILFPKGKVSLRQQKQLTSWGDNVRAFSVAGDFDDCQRMVKEAFQDEWWSRNHPLVSANSINLGRLLPQAVYYVASSLWFQRDHHETPMYFIPSGNLGNATAAMWAKRTGVPISKIVLATNANLTVSEYFRGGTWQPRPTVATLANAMDVGNPSNMERVRALYPDRTAMRAELDAISVSDDEIRQVIETEARARSEVWCPHSATAVFARSRWSKQPGIVVATAHPAKFESIVEPLVQRSIPIPPSLSAILQRPSSVTEIPPRLEALRDALRSP